MAYIPLQYPMMLYHPDGASVIVQKAADLAAIDPAYTATPIIPDAYAPKNIVASNTVAVMKAIAIAAPVVKHIVPFHTNTRK